jgi:hypothetical protein
LPARLTISAVEPEKVRVLAGARAQRLSVHLRVKPLWRSPPPPRMAPKHREDRSYIASALA